CYCKLMNLFDYIKLIGTAHLAKPHKTANSVLLDILMTSRESHCRRKSNLNLLLIVNHRLKLLCTFRHRWVDVGERNLSPLSPFQGRVGSLTANTGQHSILRAGDPFGAKGGMRLKDEAFPSFEVVASGQLQIHKTMEEKAQRSPSTQTLQSKSPPLAASSTPYHLLFLDTLFAPRGKSTRLKNLYSSWEPKEVDAH
ncbi:hypothetical protein STEG23_025194, partial [Scotinomys teguina]